MPNPMVRMHEKEVDVDAIQDTGFIYRDGPWSLCVDEVISAVVSGGSPLSRWIPVRGVRTRNEHVAHLGWIAPKGFTGATSYIDYLAALDPLAKCDFGPSTDWNGCEYSHSSFRVSFQSDVIDRREVGLLECERQPIYRMRGPQRNLPIDNDADWSLARVGFQMEQHLDWNLIYGDPTVGQLMYDGLDLIIDTGWVAAHAVGDGTCEFTDPIVINCAALDTPEKVLTVLKGVIRQIRTRARDRGYRLTPNDYAVVMPRALWGYLADHIACGAFAGACTTTMQLDVSAWFSERRRISEGFNGDGFIEIDGSPVPVIVEDLLGANADITVDEETVPGVTGDIYVLTRSFAGRTILEHQYTDWRQMPVPAPLDEVIMQNGMLRTGWKILNSTCYQYFAEMEGRLISRFQPLQARINNVSVATILENENEVGAFTSPDFYAFGGNRGGLGVDYLTGRIGA